MTDAALDIKNLRKTFPAHERPIIPDLSLTLAPGTCLSLLGPSGCGKTTLLRLLMGLEQPSAGSIVIAPSLATQMAYVFQEPRLVPWRTALENVLLPLELTRRNRRGRHSHAPHQDEGRNDADGHRRARELLQRLGLDARIDNFPHQLSGGMQMRVALARALITQPKLLLLDEPFAALDERTRFRLQDLLLELKHTLNLQYIFVTHSISEAIYLGDRVLLLDQNGRQNLLRDIDLDPRNQDTKLGAAFNAIAQNLSAQFAAIERAA